MPGPGTCTLGNRDGQPLPDPRCTSGAVNAVVRLDTIKDTICQAGVDQDRPPAHVEDERDEGRIRPVLRPGAR
jgi:hypothetical protein